MSSTAIKKTSESLASPIGTYAATAQKGLLVRLARLVRHLCAACSRALYVGATTFPDGTFIPWRPIMVDLEVYRRAGSVLLAGGNFYDLPGPLQFLYPPFAAVLAVPLALSARPWSRLAGPRRALWRLSRSCIASGLTGWLLSRRRCSVYVVEPVVQTLAFGQLGIFLVALVVLDLVPGPRMFPRRLLPGRGC